MIRIGVPPGAEPVTRVPDTVRAQIALPVSVIGQRRDCQPRIPSEPTGSRRTVVTRLPMLTPESHTVAGPIGKFGVANGRYLPRGSGAGRPTVALLSITPLRKLFEVGIVENSRNDGNTDPGLHARNLGEAGVRWALRQHLDRTTLDSANHPSSDCSFPGLSERVARRGPDEWALSKAAVSGVNSETLARVAKGSSRPRP